jgi:putative ABC transport system permease protein
METLIKDIRYGVRMLGSRPGFTAVAALALALGVGANSVVFSVVNSVLLRPLPYPDADRLVAVWGVSERANTDHFVFSYPNYRDLREQTEGFESAAAYDSVAALLTGGDEPERLRGIDASADIFPMLGVTPLLGRGFGAEEDSPGASPVVVLGYEVWERHFVADPDIIGKEIPLNGRATTVIGVMPRGFKFPLQASAMDFIKPLAPALGAQLTQRNSISLRMAARLRPGASLERAQAQIDAVALRLEQQYPDSNKGLGTRLTPMRDDLVRRVRLALLVLLGAVGCVLLIACANVANLLLARGASRQKEFAVRTALGASRIRVFRQLLTESLMLSLFGGGVGTLLAIWAIDLLVRYSGPASVPRVAETRLDGRALGFTVIISLLSGIVFGMAPAFGAARSNLNERLKEGGRQSVESGRNRLRGLLVAAEIALSIVLLVGAGLLINSFIRLQNVSPGFNPENRLTTSLSVLRTKYPQPDQQAGFFDRTLESLKAVPGVESAAAVSPLPFGGGEEVNTFAIEGGPRALPGEEPAAFSFVISPGYCKTMGVPVLTGREFTDADGKTSTRVVMISSLFARQFFAGENPIGRRILIGVDADNPNPPAWEIVGIVGDVKNAGLDTEPGPQFYMPYPQSPVRQMDLVMKTASTGQASAAGAIRTAIRQIDGEQFIPNVRPMEQLMAAWTAQRRFIMMLLGIFAGVALVLAATGIYGVMAYSVTQRTHEMGIRMALGAARADVMKLVLWQGMALAGIGIGAGLGAAFILGRFAASLLYEVNADDPLTFGIMSLLLGAVALAACCVPAYRATTVDPAIALRYE